jgi:hypothetical protein
MNMRTKMGFALVIPAAYYLCVALGIVGGAMLPQIKNRLGIKDPHAEQLQVLEAKLDKAQGALDAANAAAIKARDDKATQTALAEKIPQGYVHGINVEAAKDKPNLDTIRSFAGRADQDLISIFGPLSEAQMASIQHEADLRAQGKVDEANALAAEKDKELQGALEQVAAAQKIITDKDAAIVSVTKDRNDAHDKLTATTAQVVEATKTLYAKAVENTGLSGYLQTMKFWAEVALGAYIFCHFAMPSIDDELDKSYPKTGPQPMWVTWYHSIYNTVKSLICGH